MKNTVAMTRERWDRWPLAGAAVGRQRLSPRRFRGAAVLGELATVIFLFASGSVPPGLVRALQLFLRF